MRRRRLLDLFCCAGGAAAGYVRAGFEVVGVDIAEQPRYLGSGAAAFVRADALEYLSAHGDDFDAVHASPPCQAYSTVAAWSGRIHGAPRDYPKLIEPTRAALGEWSAGRPWVIENIVGAPLIDPIRLCGSSFGRPLRRHRLFESNVMLLAPPCAHRALAAVHRVPLGAPSRHVGKDRDRSRFVAVYGSTRYAGELADRMAAMGIDWMRNEELTQAIPPDYTELIGWQLMATLESSPP